MLNTIHTEQCRILILTLSTAEWRSARSKSSPHLTRNVLSQGTVGHYHETAAVHFDKWYTSNFTT